MILQFATHIDVGKSCGSNGRCRVPKEVSGHCNGKVESIPKAYRGIGRRVSQENVWKMCVNVRKIHRAWLR